MSTILVHHSNSISHYNGEILEDVVEIASKTSERIRMLRTVNNLINEIVDNAVSNSLRIEALNATSNVLENVVTRSTEIATIRADNKQLISEILDELIEMGFVFI